MTPETSERVTKIGIGFLLGVFGGYVFFLLTRKAQTQLGRTAAPTMVGPSHAFLLGGAAPAPQPSGGAKGPILLTSNPIPVVTGRKYRAIMSVGFPFSMMASEPAVRKEAEDLGFSDVKVFTDRPSDFPGTRRGDYYLEAMWSSPSTSIARPNIPGLSLVEAWEG